MSRKRGSRRWTETVSVVREALVRGYDDRIYNLAAEIAFYLVVALPAVVVGAAGGIGFFLSPEASASIRGEILGWANQVFSAAFSQRWIVPVVERFLSGGAVHLLLMGLAAALWMMGRVVHTTVEVIRIAYDEERRKRRSWRERLAFVRAAAVALLGALVIGSVAVAGPKLIDAANPTVGLSVLLHTLLWTGVAALAGVYLWWLYGVAPDDGHQRRRLPGALTGTVLGGAGSVVVWLQASWLFAGGGVLGPLALPFVVMGWAYVLGFAALLGAEANRVAEDRGESR